MQCEHKFVLVMSALDRHGFSHRMSGIGRIRFQQTVLAVEVISRIIFQNPFVFLFGEEFQPGLGGAYALAVEGLAAAVDFEDRPAYFFLPGFRRLPELEHCFADVAEIQAERIMFRKIRRADLPGAVRLIELPAARKINARFVG